MLIAVLAYFHVIKPTLSYSEEDVSKGLQARCAPFPSARFPLTLLHVIIHAVCDCCALRICSGPQNFLICIEMLIAAVAHHRYFSWQARTHVCYHVHLDAAMTISRWSCVRECRSSRLTATQACR